MARHGMAGGVSGSAGSALACFALRPAHAHPIALAQQLRLPAPGVADVAMRGDGKIFASAGWDGKVRVFGWKRKEALAILKVRVARGSGLNRWW